MNKWKCPFCQHLNEDRDNIFPALTDSFHVRYECGKCGLIVSDEKEGMIDAIQFV